jgi:hypothetical protein
MRDNWLSNRMFKLSSNHCCFAWNRRIDRPWPIMIIGMRDCVFLACCRAAWGRSDLPPSPCCLRRGCRPIMPVRREDERKRSVANPIDTGLTFYGIAMA